MSSNFCSKCGAQLKEDTPFCPNCGASLHTKPIATTYSETSAVESKTALNEQTEPKSRFSWWNNASGKRKAVYVFIFLIFFSGITYNGESYEAENEPTYETVVVWTEDFNTDWWPVMLHDYPMVTVPEGTKELILTVDWEEGTRETTVKLFLWESDETKDRNIGNIYSNKVKTGSKSITKSVSEVRDFFVEATLLEYCEGTITLSAVVPKGTAVKPVVNEPVINEPDTGETTIREYPELGYDQHLVFLKTFDTINKAGLSEEYSFEKVKVPINAYAVSFAIEWEDGNEDAVVDFYCFATGDRDVNVRRVTNTSAEGFEMAIYNVDDYEPLTELTTFFFRAEEIKNCKGTLAILATVKRSNETEPVEPEPEYEAVPIWEVIFDTTVDFIDNEQYRVVNVPAKATHINMGVGWKAGMEDVNFDLKLWEFGKNTPVMTIDQTDAAETGSLKEKGVVSRTYEIGESREFYVSVQSISMFKGIMSLSVIVPAGTQVQMVDNSPVEEPTVTEPVGEWVQRGSTTAQVGSTMINLASFDEGDKVKFEFISLGANGLPAVFTGVSLVLDGEIVKSKGGMTNAQPKTSWEVTIDKDGFYQLKVDLTVSPATVKMYRWE